MVRAKFYVDSVTKYKWGGVKLEMRPVYADKSEENKKFWDATPTGMLDMTIKNNDAAAFFEVGKEYYLDFTEAE